MRSAGIVFDLPMESKDPSDEAQDLFDRNSRIRGAVEKADQLSKNRMISQDDFQSIESDLPAEDRYAFHMALVDADLRVRTGGRVATIYDIEDRYDKWSPHRLSVPDDLLRVVLRRKIGVVAGLEVWLVNPEKARLIDVDFTIGGNGARCGYIPVNQIWLADTSSPSDMAPICGHEAIEFYSMKVRGMNYEEAHERANLFERNLRRQIAEGEVDISDLTSALRVANELFAMSKTASVNVVDREEPVVRDLGDSFVNSTNLWTADPSVPRDELNTDPQGTMELEYGKPRRSEGELHAEFGNNLTDLTVEGSLKSGDPVLSVKRVAQGYGEGAFAVSLDDILAMLNHAVSLEYSQSLRYNIYADTLRLAYRDALAEEFENHAEEELEHAKALSAKIVSLGGVLSPSIQEPVRIPPNEPNLVDNILRELWKQEQEGIKFYRSLKKALGSNIFIHYIEEVLVAESEHVDDLMRFGAMLKSAEIVPQPSAPFRVEPARWADSYSSENQFEGTDKMGTSELGKCPHCEGDEVFGQVCEKCTGKTATVVRALCEVCDGFGFVKTCLYCGESWAPPPLLSVGRIASWQRRAGSVQRKTMYGEIPVWIEQEVGDIKRGKNREGVTWERKMKAAYGFVPGTRGADGEPLDVYLGEHPTRKVYVVSQMRPSGGFDEEKAMLGFPNVQQAEAVYRSHMPHNGDRHFGGIREMSVGEFENEYLKSDAANPYKPRLQLRQFEVTGQKLVSNPNPKGREKQVTEEYADRWKSEHGQGGAEKSSPDVFQKYKQEKAKPSAPVESKPSEPAQDVFQKYKQDKPTKEAPVEAKEPVQEPLVATEPAKEAPEEPAKAVEPSAPVEQPAAPTKDPMQEPLEKSEHGWPVDDKSIPAPPITVGEYNAIHLFLRPDITGKAPLTKFTVDDFAKGTGLPKDKAEKMLATLVAGDERFERGSCTKNKDGTFSPWKEVKPLSKVDTSRAMSPVEEQDRRSQGKAKELEMQFWRLLGGPGFNPYKTSVLDLHKLASRVIAESYSQPDHGPLGTDGEPDHPKEDNVVMHASVEDWPFSVSAAVLLERVARGDLVKVQGPTGWVGLVSKETMAKEPGKYVPVTEKKEGPQQPSATPEVPKKSEDLVEPMTPQKAAAQGFHGKRNWVDDKPEGLPDESWHVHFTGHPWEGGKPKPERVPLHEEIISKYFDSVPPVAPGQQKIAIMTMGGPASGKTTMLSGIDRRNFVIVDPDDIKTQIPEYIEGSKPEATWKEASHCVHKESTHIGDELQDRAMKAGKNLVIDGTGVHAAGFEQKMRLLKSLGYKVKVYMPDLDEETALIRMRQRAAQTGRYVMDEALKEIYKVVPGNFNRLARQADEAYLFDARRSIPSADGKERPRLVWSMGSKGEKQHDKAFVSQFLARSGGAAINQPMPAKEMQPAAA